MTNDLEPPAPARSPVQTVTTHDVARGAGFAGLARLGALIELVAQPAYVGMFGVATYGLYVVLWGAISLVSNFMDMSLTSALQRIVPTRDSEAQAHGAVKLALLVAVVPTSLVALVVSLNAEAVAGIFSAAPEDAVRLPAAIALFVWALPLWTFIEICTSAARARRAFGPEIRLRIFWEQLARLVFAVGFFLVGFRSTGLMAAHLCSLALTAALCVPLLGRYYDWRLLLAAPVPAPLARDLVGTGLSLLPSDLLRRFLIDGPPLVLNLILPGARGAQAAGLLEVARKLSTATNIIRLAFRYVMAPLAAAQARADRAGMAPLYHFACRVSTALVGPLAAALILTGPDIMLLYPAEAAAALPLLYILVVARFLEAMLGPASDVVEMTGHRGLPLLNSALAAIVLAGLSILLIPGHGAMGMAVAVSAALVVNAVAAAAEVRIVDGLSPVDRRMAVILAVIAAGTALMVAASIVPHGIVHFLIVGVALLLGTAWTALRLGLPREDRLALGRLGRIARLV